MFFTYFDYGKQFSNKMKTIWAHRYNRLLVKVNAKFGTGRQNESLSVAINKNVSVCN